MGADDVEGDGFGRHADEDHAAARAKRIEDTLESADIAAGFENDVSSPTFRRFLQHFGDVLLTNVHRA